MKGVFIIAAVLAVRIRIGIDSAGVVWLAGCLVRLRRWREMHVRTTGAY